MEKGRDSAGSSSHTAQTRVNADDYIQVETLSYPPQSIQSVTSERRSKPPSVAGSFPLEQLDAPAFPPSSNWYAQRAWRLSSRYPRLWKVWQYFRGPRPKRDLAGAHFCSTVSRYSPRSVADRTIAVPEFDFLLWTTQLRSRPRAGVDPLLSSVNSNMVARPPHNRIHYRFRLLLPCTIFPGTPGCIHRLYLDILVGERWLWSRWTELRSICI